MKVILLPCALFILTWIGAEAQTTPDYYYDSRYDYLDIDAILDNKRLVRNYVDCLLNQKPCSPEGKVLRRILPEGLRTKCSRCTPRQKRAALAVLKRLRADYPEEWGRLAARWDPTGDFTRRFEDILDDGNSVDHIQPKPSPSPTPSTMRPTTRSTTRLPTTTTLPMLGNRFGSDDDDDKPVVMMTSSQAPPRPEDEEQGAPSDMRPTVRAAPASTTTVRSTFPTAAPTTFKPVKTTMRPSYTQKPVKTTQRPKIHTTTFRYIYEPSPSYNNNNNPIYTGTMGLIDHFGNKIIRTTELVTDLLKNTVRAVLH